MTDEADGTAESHPTLCERTRQRPDGLSVVDEAIRYVELRFVSATPKVQYLDFMFGLWSRIISSLVQLSRFVFYNWDQSTFQGCCIFYFFIFHFALRFVVGVKLKLRASAFCW